ncbi:MAG: energy-coupling factor ABC transporter permease [Chloroflexota bacterium]|jgi:cobalt/nickel transport system permease protein
MSHLHIPDGVMPLWIIALGWVATIALLILSTGRLRRGGLEIKLSLLGMMSALMLVAMSLELIPIGYHVNLTVVSGILLGPTLAFVAAFVVNLILAFFGHSGITVVGLNTLLIGTEMELGYFLFRAGRGLVTRGIGVGLLAGAVTVVSLLAGSLLMIGVVALSNVNPGIARPEATIIERGGEISFRNPFGEGAVAWRPFGEEPEPSAPPEIDIATFATLVLGLGAVGWIVEAVITGAIIRYLVAVRPDLIGVTRPPGRG